MTATHAQAPCVDRAPVELPQPVRMRILLRGHDRHLPGRPRPDGRGHGAAAHRHRPARQRRLHVGLHRLPADRHHQRPDLRQALRPLRSAAHLPARHRHLPASAPCWPGVSPSIEWFIVCPWHPGPRRRRAVPHRARHHRRHLRAVRAGQVPGPLRGRLRPLRSSSARPSAASSPTPWAGTGCSSSTCPSAPWSLCWCGATCPPTTSAATGPRSTTSVPRSSRPRSCPSSSASPTSRPPTGPIRPWAA